jgi:hypothetical protein
VIDMPKDILLAVGISILLTGFLYASIHLPLHLSGWGRLAEQFRSVRGFEGQSAWGCSAWMGRNHYRGMLRIGFNHDGLYVAAIFPPLIGHPPLFIPWSEIKIYPQTRPWYFYPERPLRLGSEADIPFIFDNRRAEKLLSQYRPIV